MPKSDGEKTKARILEVAEALFYKHGFDGTSVDKIAKTAKVNKALIYYHFKNKKDLVFSVFMNSLEELNAHMGSLPEPDQKRNAKQDHKAKISKEIEFLFKKKKSLSIMLMESIKASAKDNYLYRIAEIVMQDEMARHQGSKTKSNRKSSKLKKQALVFEFFTGFIPIVAFIAMRDTWCDYFDCSKDEALAYFVDSFEKSHLTSHIKDW